MALPAEETDGRSKYGCIINKTMFKWRFLCNNIVYITISIILLFHTFFPFCLESAIARLFFN